MADSFRGFTFADDDPRVGRMAVEEFKNSAGGVGVVKANFDAHGVLVPGVHFVEVRTPQSRC